MATKAGNRRRLLVGLGVVAVLAGAFALSPAADDLLGRGGDGADWRSIEGVSSPVMLASGQYHFIEFGWASPGDIRYAVAGVDGPRVVDVGIIQSTEAAAVHFRGFDAVTALGERRAVADPTGTVSLPAGQYHFAIRCLADTACNLAVTLHLPPGVDAAQARLDLHQTVAANATLAVEGGNGTIPFAVRQGSVATVSYAMSSRAGPVQGFIIKASDHPAWESGGDVATFAPFDSASNDRATADVEPGDYLIVAECPTTDPDCRIVYSLFIW